MRSLYGKTRTDNPSIGRPAHYSAVNKIDRTVDRLRGSLWRAMTENVRSLATRPSTIAQEQAVARSRATRSDG